MNAIVEAREDRDREIKAVKTALADITTKLDLLVQDKARRDGALGLGRWLIAIGIPSLLGGGLLWIWQYFEGKN